MPDEIKPCPECNNSEHPPQVFQFPADYGIARWRNGWTAMCPECMGDFSSDEKETHPTRDEAVAAWNAGVEAWIAEGKAGAERGGE